MRTTLTIDDSINKKLRDVVKRTGKTYKEVVNETLKSGLMVKNSGVRPYRLRPCSLGEVSPEYDLNKSLKLADQLGDDEIVRKLAMRK